MNPLAPTAEALAARILALVADNLDRSATLTHPLGGQVHLCMNVHHRDLVISDIENAIGRVHGATTRNTLRGAILPMLPPAAGTVADYANALRALAA